MGFSLVFSVVGFAGVLEYKSLGTSERANERTSEERTCVPHRGATVLRTSSSLVEEYSPQPYR